MPVTQRWAPVTSEESCGEICSFNPNRECTASAGSSASPLKVLLEFEEYLSCTPAINARFWIRFILSRRMTLKSFTFNPFSTNCYVVESEGEAVIVDPSCMTKQEISAVVDYISQNGFEIRHLLLTHGHIDHIFGCNALSEAYQLEWRIHVDDAPLLENAPLQAEMFGIPLDTPNSPGAALADGDQISFGRMKLDVLHTPGHSPGSVSFSNQKENYVIAGDVLFRGSIGRTDLWKGSLPVLMQSIFQKIVPLGDDVSVYSGHGPETTVGIEVETNPFLTGSGDFGL